MMQEEKGKNRRGNRLMYFSTHHSLFSLMFPAILIGSSMLVTNKQLYLS